MSAINKTGSLAWIGNKLKEAAEAGEITLKSIDPTTKEQAAFDAATKIAEAVGIGIPVWFIDKTLTKTGLDRVFDSLRKNKSFEQYLRDQTAQRNLRDLGISTIAEWSLHELREWISENQVLDPAFDLITEQFQQAKTWTWPRDPLILDLNGNGLQTVGLSTSEAWFDHDGDGVRTRTGWVGQGDALLVWDRNANGNIDTGAELFGDFTPLPNGALAPNGFAALAALDTNGDGVIDASDPAFAELRLWLDPNGNAATEAGELMNLAQAGITSLSLGHTLMNQRQANGNASVSNSPMGTYYLANNNFDTRFDQTSEISEDTSVLACIQHLLLNEALRTNHCFNENGRPSRRPVLSRAADSFWEMAA